MRIALIVGVSDYRRLASFPSCKRDAAAINDLLEEAHSFDHILCLSGDLQTQETKERMFSFLESFRGNSVKQALFYFSGHGALLNGGLLYLLSDYDENRPLQTSIENDEVDSWLRELASEVTVKIVDCCHSGASYVKDSATVETAMARSKGQLANCYFLAASHADERAYAGEKFSEFTECILEGLSERDLGAIHYKDIVDIVFDCYKDNNSQRPYYVQQGSLRDVFYDQTEQTRGLLKRLMNSEDAPEPGVVLVGAPAKKSLLELVESSAQGMITRERAVDCLVELRQSVEKIELDLDLQGLYEIKLEFLTWWEADIENEEAVGKWVNRYGGGLFAEAVEEEVKTRIPYRLLDPMDASMNPWGKVESKVEITGVRVTANLDYDLVRLRLEPKFPNLATFQSAFLLLWSKRDAVLFRYASLLRAVNWSENQVPERIKWKVVRLSASGLGTICDLVLATFREMEKQVKADLHQRFQPAQGPS